MGRRTAYAHARLRGPGVAVIVSTFGFFAVPGRPGIVLDPLRIAAQVASGVGFPGAGTLLFLQREQVIRGPATAAGLWAVASVGLAAGAGLYAAAIMATLLMWAILALLKPLEQRYLHRRAHSGRLRLRIAAGTPLARVENAASDAGLPVRRITLRPREQDNDIVDIDCDPPLPRAQMLARAEQLGRVESVVPVELPGLAEGWARGRGAGSQCAAERAAPHPPGQLHPRVQRGSSAPLWDRAACRPQRAPMPCIFGEIPSSRIHHKSIWCPVARD